MADMGTLIWKLNPGLCIWWAEILFHWASPQGWIPKTKPFSSLLLSWLDPPVDFCSRFWCYSELIYSNVILYWPPIVCLSLCSFLFLPFPALQEVETMCLRYFCSWLPAWFCQQEALVGGWQAGGRGKARVFLLPYLPWLVYPAGLHSLPPDFSFAGTGPRVQFLWDALGCFQISWLLHHPF
jgi:hypothetical protein